MEILQWQFLHPLIPSYVDPSFHNNTLTAVDAFFNVPCGLDDPMLCIAFPQDAVDWEVWALFTEIVSALILVAVEC